METKELTSTELLVKINSLKDKHEILKKEIIDALQLIEEKEKELLSVEEQYVKLMAQLAL
jgi:replicative DNA helicase